MTSDSPFFSVIIPTYNRAHLISRAIESVLGQTFKDWELIVIDDGSTDDTQAKVLGFQDQRLRYVWQENAERSAARNHGIRLAKGKYVCFQDSDDWYRPNHLAVHFDAISKNGFPNFVKTRLIIHTVVGEVQTNHSNFADYYSLGVASAFTCYSIKREKLELVQFDTRFYVGEDLHFLARLTFGEVVHLEDQPTVECKESNLFGADGLLTKGNFNKVLSNKILCFCDISNWLARTSANEGLYFKKEIILAACYRVGLDLKYSQFESLFADLFDLLKLMLKFPFAALQFFQRFLFVKISEGFGRTFDGNRRF